MTKIRWPIDYLDLIHRHGYDDLFDWYCEDHRNLSLKRNARAFCQKYDLVKFFYWRVLRHFNMEIDYEL